MSWGPRARWTRSPHSTSTRNWVSVRQGDLGLDEGHVGDAPRLGHGVLGHPAGVGPPANARETHVSLFDGSTAGIELTDRRAFSVQYHPEASPGPQDSLYLFERFVGSLR